MKRLSVTFLRLILFMTACFPSASPPASSEHESAFFSSAAENPLPSPLQEHLPAASPVKQKKDWTGASAQIKEASSWDKTVSKSGYSTNDT